MRMVPEWLHLYLRRRRLRLRNQRLEAEAPVLSTTPTIRYWPQPGLYGLPPEEEEAVRRALALAEGVRTTPPYDDV
jgi:hypothetical protein